MAPLVIHIFCPLSTQCLPSGARSARVLSPIASEPASASLRQYEEISSVEARRGRYFFFCSSVPK